MDTYLCQLFWWSRERLEGNTESINNKVETTKRKFKTFNIVFTNIWHWDPDILIDPICLSFLSSQLWHWSDWTNQVIVFLLCELQTVSVLYVSFPLYNHWQLSLGMISMCITTGTQASAKCQNQSAHPNCFMVVIGTKRGGSWAVPFLWKLALIFCYLNYSFFARSRFFFESIQINGPLLDVKQE